MKHLTLLAFAALLHLTLFTSCGSEDEPATPKKEPVAPVIMMDAGKITGMDFGVSHIMDIQSEATVNSYFEINLLAKFISEDISYDEMKEPLHSAVEKYYDDRTSVIQEEFRKFGASSNYWPLFFTGYINGEVSITCDKTLFGMQPGENLSSHFITGITYGCMPIGRGTPTLRYSFTDHPREMSMKEFFVKDAWLQTTYIFAMMDTPEETYSDITLTLSLPISRECVNDYFKAQLNGTPTDMKVVNEVLTASCKIHFQ